MKKYYNEHRKAFDTWTHGEPKECWKDKLGIFCISYEDGKWWHYKDTENGLEWW